MELLGESSPLIIAGIITTLVAFVVFLIGFATPYWYKIGSGHSGLWESCINDNCFRPSTGLLSDSFKAAQAMECLAFIAFIVAIVCIVLKLFVMKDQRMLYIIIGLANLIAGVLGLIGVIIYGTQDYLDSSHFHFSFAFCIIASIAVIVSGVLFIIGRKK